MKKTLRPDPLPKWWTPAHTEAARKHQRHRRKLKRLARQRPRDAKGRFLPPGQ